MRGDLSPSELRTAPRIECHWDQLCSGSGLRCIMTSWRGSGGSYDSWQLKHYNINTPPRAQHTGTPHSHWEEPQSPHGTKRCDRDLPNTFQPDSQHFDTKQQFGLIFPRHITATAWSQKYQFAGRSIEFDFKN